MAYGAQQLQALQGISGMLSGGYGFGALMQGQNQLYQNYLQGPAYLGQYNEILRGAGGLQMRINRGLRGRGAPGAGVNVMARNVGQAFAHSQLGGLQGQAWQGAGQMAGQNIGQRTSALSYLGQNIRYPDPNQPGMGQRIAGYGMAGLGMALPFMFPQAAPFMAPGQIGSGTGMFQPQYYRG